ncbi:MAG: type III pantothenate kinase [Planctomycetes bacterium]|nr:type III pantothenate kinase [Planctomycetota bacterium]
MSPRFGIDLGNTRAKLHRLPDDDPPDDPVELERRALQIPGSPFDREALAGLPDQAQIEIVSVKPAEAEKLCLELEAAGHRPRIWSAAELPIANPYTDPARLGPDRPLAALAAGRLVGAPAIVVDAGTALTVDLLDRQGRFAGGAIAPGFRLLARSLAVGGAMLHEVEARAFDYPGRSSDEALALGVRAAFFGALGQLVGGARAVVVEAPVLVTGGDAELALEMLGALGARSVPLMAIGLWLLAGEPRS